MSFSTLWKRVLNGPRRSAMTHGDAVSQVAQAYEIVLGRAADELGLRTYSEKLASGQETILGIVQAMLDSPEGRSLRGNGVQQESATSTESDGTLESVGTPEKAGMLEGDASLENDDPLENDDSREQDRSKLAESVNSLYRIVLHRDADEAGLAHHVEKLVNNEISLVDLVQAFHASDEFAISFSRNRNVARHIVKTLFGGLTSRPPSVDTIEIYSNAMAHGYSLADLLTELKASPEFDAGSQKVTATELAILAQDLIASHLVREGCVIGLPPMAVHSTPMPAAQMAALLRTLAMLSANNGPH